jgi:hypothetical protein
VHLSEKKYFHALSSPTFHGREIFAPVAAYLSRGVKLESLGPLIQDPVKLDVPHPYEQDGFLYGQIVRIDHFGNLLTNLSRERVEAFLQSHSPRIEVGQRILGKIHSVYAEVAPGEILALMDSSGYLEIAANRGRATDLLGIDSEELLGLKVKISKFAD